MILLMLTGGGVSDTDCFLQKQLVKCSRSVTEGVGEITRAPSKEVLFAFCRGNQENRFIAIG